MLRTTFILGVGFFLNLASFSTFANEHLLKHVQAVGQTMSALYMTSLSHGSNKYKRDMEFYKQAAQESLAQYVTSQGKGHEALQKAWNTIQSDIKLEYSETYEWDPDEALRRDFRQYQSNAYQLVSEQMADYKQAPLSVLLAAAQAETLIARFFDVTTSYNGTISLSPIDAEKVDPKTISQQFDASLTQLIKNTQDNGLKKQIESALYKWKFIEESVVNYSDASAHFLVYATKNKIHQVLSQNRLVSVN